MYIMNRRCNALHLLLIVGIALCLVAVALEDKVCSAEDDECINDDNNVDNNNDNNNVDINCIDEHENCKSWAKIGECDENPEYMLVDCRRSCNVCKFEYDENEFGKVQYASNSEVKQIIKNSVEYMQSIKDDPKYSKVIEDCLNTDERCSEWALGTGCNDNPSYMKLHCSPACQSCDYVLEKLAKCALDPNGKDAIEVGGMDGLFERMIQVAHDSNWQPTVLSRPVKKDDTSCEQDLTNPCDTIDGPWIITLENFITDKEIATLLDYGTKLGYERSQAGDEVVEARTSSHAWCSGDCAADPIVTNIQARIAHVTGIPVEHYECLQLLKYVVGTYYKPHVDFIEDHVKQSHGSRLLTFFMYFNEVKSGGGTRFSKINLPDGLTVQPSPGKVLIWPSVLDSDLYKEDKRTEHEAIPVEEGEKYSANAWIHTRDFQTPFSIGCPS